MKMMKNKLKTILKWIMYIYVPQLILVAMIYILNAFAGNLPFQLVYWLGPSQEKIFFTQPQEVFYFKVTFIMCLSIFFTVFICSVYMLVRSNISFLKSIIFNFIASFIGMAIGAIVFYITIGKKPIESFERLHPEIVPACGFIGIILMAVILIIKSKQANRVAGGFYPPSPHTTFLLPTNSSNFSAESLL